VLPGVSLGAMYASRIRMGKLKAYSALLADGGQFDVPERYGLGLAVRALAGLTFAADVMRVNWGDIASLGNALTDPQPGFGWRNQTIVRAGVAWDVQPQWTLRAGYSHGTQIVSSDNTTLNYLAPVTPQQHLTLGATWKLDPTSPQPGLCAGDGHHRARHRPQHRGGRAHVAKLAGRRLVLGLVRPPSPCP
jgi:long-chain fatty acid transport protein